MINHYAEQLKAAGLDVFPCAGDKSPAIPRGTSWQTVAKQHPAAINWPSGVVGLPVPRGVVVLDLDIYKGVTREEVEQSLGCALPWDAALIQTTQRGGHHYAFAVDWDVKQGSNVAGVTGFDTRVGLKGYIATGEGYTATGFGPFAMAHPAALPRLPDAARGALEHTAPTNTAPTPLPEGDRDVDTIRDALAHIDPGCGRSDWLRVGLALRHHFHDDESTGLTLFDAWSSGAFTEEGEAPANYVPETTPHQWASFKPEGATTIASLFYAAVASGWKPPAGINTAAAFGGTAPAPAEQFDEVVDRIIERGGDPKETDGLIARVYGLPCNELQRGVLLATLHRELKEAGLLTKEVKRLLEGAKPARPQGEYGKNHTENAAIFADTHYPDGQLVRSQEVWYTYNGRAWEALTDAEIKHELAVAMAPCMPQHSTVAGTYNMLEALAANPGKKIGDIPDGLVLMQNGALNLYTGAMTEHRREYFTTNILPYNYNIQARCDTWRTFLDNIFEGDQERVALLQEWFGYLLSGGYQHQKVMLLLGPKRCGKGTIGRVLKLLVGDQNYTGGTLTSFADDAFIESLQTKTTMFVGDAAKNIPRSVVDYVTERIKGISGCDDQTFRRKYKSTLSEQIPTRVTIASNHVPRLFDDSGALASRLLVLPFNVSWYDREDPTLFGRLAMDIEGIAIWALQGLARLNQTGHFTLPEISKAEIDYISESYSPLRLFLEQCCEVGNDSRFVAAQDAYDAYKSWAITSQEDAIMSRRPFIAALRDIARGTGVQYGVHRVNGSDTPQRGFRGLVLKTRGDVGSIPLHAVK